MALPGGARAALPCAGCATAALRRTSHRCMESRCWLGSLPAVDGRQYVYRVDAPEDAQTRR